MFMAYRSGVMIKDNAGLRRFNNFLTFVVIGISLYIIIMPVVPQIQFWLKQRSGGMSNTVVYSADDKAGSKPIPKDNRLVIPQMALDATVNEGKYANTLKHGLWRRPNTSTPDKGGNTVIVGHRFTYSSPAIFYHLDKIKVNDELSLFWEEKEYRYKIQEIKTVEPSAVEVEDNTEEPTLTLYTCTPLWTSKHRLVIVAKLIEDTNL